MSVAAPERPTRKPPNGSKLRWLLTVVVPSDTDDCLVPPFGLGARGRLQIDTGGVKRYATHVVLDLTGNPWRPPLGCEAVHSCDNPPCVNPRHLSWATHHRNMREMHDRGRARSWGWGAGR